MRFVRFRMRNEDPAIPARWVDWPLALDEPAVCNVQEEYDRTERLPLHWDDGVWYDTEYLTWQW